VSDAAGPGSAHRATVAVIGGGIAGLAAAWELSGGAAGPGPGTPAVVVLEAGDRLGGKLRSESFEGRRLDSGPDGFLGRRPEAVALCREIGLDESLRPIGASGAAVWARGRRRPLPDGLALGIPTKFWPLVRSGILGFGGNVRVLLDVIAPRPDSRGPLGDRAIGPLVARKLGRRVVDTMVDPMIGGIHAGSVADMSAAAVFPVLLAASKQGSFMRSLRRAMAAPPPVATAPPEDPDESAGPAEPEPDTAATEPAPAFYAVEGGFATLVEQLEKVLGDRDVELRCSSAVQVLQRAGHGPRRWELSLEEGSLEADGIVLAVPPQPAAELLDDHDEEAAGLLRSIDQASVVLVTFAFDADAVPEDLFGTGLLVPPGSKRPPADDGDTEFLITACTLLSAKWPHLALPGESLVRASAGRMGDERIAELDDMALQARMVEELGLLLGIEAEPRAVRVTRWPGAFPQYRVNHLLRVAGIEAGVRRLPAMTIAGSAYRGVGIPACIGSGREAARELLGVLAPDGGEAGSGR